MEKHRIVRMTAENYDADGARVWYPIRVDTPVWSGDRAPNADDWAEANSTAEELAVDDGQAVRLAEQTRRKLGGITLPFGWHDVSPETNVTSVPSQAV